MLLACAILRVPRTTGEYAKAVQGLSDEDQVFRLNWILQIAKVLMIPNEFICADA